MDVKQFLYDYGPILLPALLGVIGSIWAALVAARQRQKSRCEYQLQQDLKPIPLNEFQFMFAANCASLAYPKSKQESKNNSRFLSGLTDRIQNIGGEVVKNFHSSGIDCFVAETESHLFVAIRGTCGMFDAIRDGFAWTKDAPLAGRAHAGFLGDVETLYGRMGLGSYLRKATKPIVISGHSMGAAEAIELAALCQAQGIEVAAIVALCAPRSGNRAHAEAVSQTFNSRLVRITNSRDIVSLIPPALFGYRHAGETHYFDCDGNYHAALTLGFRIADLIYANVRALSVAVFKLRFNYFRDLLGFHSAIGVVQLIENTVNEFNLTPKDDTI